MQSRTIILFSILILVAIIASLFAYFYTRAADQMVNKYIAQITTCGNITGEADCYARDFCEGIYGSSCVDCKEIEFLKCIKVSPKVEASLKKQHALCDQTGGRWYRNKLGSSCLCEAAGINATFNKDLGCITTTINR